MSRGDAIAKLISARHHCFARGILGREGGRVGGDDDFRQAFRTVNRLYVLAQRKTTPNAFRGEQNPPATRIERAA